MAYKSEINTRLAQQPLAKNTEFYPDALGLYQAVHILTQYVDVLIKTLRDQGIKTPEPTPDGTSPPPESTVDTPLHVQYPISKFIIAPAKSRIEAGRVVTFFPHPLHGKPGPEPYPDSRWGVYPGYSGLSATTMREAGQGPSNNTVIQIGFAGIALTEADAGDPVRVGFGPGIIQAEGVTYGTVYGVADSIDMGPDDDSPLRLPSGQLYPMNDLRTVNRAVRFVGFGIKRDYLWFDPAMHQRSFTSYFQGGEN